MKRDKYTCCRCGAAAEYLDEDTGTLYCRDCMEDRAKERLAEMTFDDLAEFVGLVPLGD